MTFPTAAGGPEREPSTAGEPDRELRTAVGGSDREPNSAVDRSDREPSTVVGGSDREPSTVVGGSDREPSTVVGGSDRELRTDPYLGTNVHVVTSRQGRPNLPSSGCPFCVGGREAPEPYDVRSFPNRWPALGEGRCEVVLYTSDHDATFAGLGVDGARRVVDLWAARTTALGSLPDVEFVLVFENRGPEVGATIPHPHGQIYAFDHVPSRPHRRFAAGWRPDPSPGSRLVAEHDGWRCWTDHAPVHPVSLTIAPDERVATLAELDNAGRTSLAALFVDVVGRLDRLYDRPLPYMMWINQALPQVAGRYDEPWLNIEIVSPWRAAGVSRFIAAAEVACEEYFNPVHPGDLAARLRALAEDRAG